MNRTGLQSHAAATSSILLSSSQYIVISASIDPPLRHELVRPVGVVRWVSVGCPREYDHLGASWYGVATENDVLSRLACEALDLR